MISCYCIIFVNIYMRKAWYFCTYIHISSSSLSRYIQQINMPAPVLCTMGWNVLWSRIYFVQLQRIWKQKTNFVSTDLHGFSLFYFKLIIFFSNCFDEKKVWTLISVRLWLWVRKKQDFWPKINILKGNHCILRIRGAPVRQKLGLKKRLKKWTLSFFWTHFEVLH